VAPTGAAHRACYGGRACVRSGYSTGRRRLALIKGARGVSNHVALLDDTRSGDNWHWWLQSTLVYWSGTGNYRHNYITASSRFVFAALATARRHDFISSGTARLLLTGTTGTTTTGSSGASGTTDLTARQVSESAGTSGTTTRSSGTSGTSGPAARQVFEAVVDSWRNHDDSSSFGRDHLAALLAFGRLHQPRLALAARLAPAD
jgi:hypothetical protein